MLFLHCLSYLLLLAKQKLKLMFCHRCYAHALKLMPEVASLWYDLGLNYYHQASLTQNDQNSPAMDIEKAQQVICQIL